MKNRILAQLPDIMLQKEAVFTESFALDCQVESVPQSLLAVVGMILDGPNIRTQACDTSCVPGKSQHCIVAAVQ